MTIQTNCGAQKRRTLSLSFGGRTSGSRQSEWRDTSPLSTTELQHAVAAMVD